MDPPAPYGQALGDTSQRKQTLLRYLPVILLLLPLFVIWLPPRAAAKLPWRRTTG